MTTPEMVEKVARAIDPDSDESAIHRVRILALTAPFSEGFAADLERVCNLAAALSAIDSENERLREALRQVEALCHTETRQKLLAIVQPVLAALSSPPAEGEK